MTGSEILGGVEKAAGKGKETWMESPSPMLSHTSFLPFQYQRSDSTYGTGTHRQTDGGGTVSHAQRKKERRGKPIDGGADTILFPRRSKVATCVHFVAVEQGYW